MDGMRYWRNNDMNECGDLRGIRTKIWKVDGTDIGNCHRVDFNEYIAYIFFSIPLGVAGSTRSRIIDK